MQRLQLVLKLSIAARLRAATGWRASNQIAKAGILTGISMMPILPRLCDTEENLEATVHWTAEHSAQFVLAGGLTLADQQREYFGVLRDRFPDLLPLYERLYPAGSYGPVRSGDPHQMGRRVRELCQQYGIADRMPRPITAGHKRALNKRIVKALANPVYAMELENAPPASASGPTTRQPGPSKTWSRTWDWSTSRWGARGWRASRTSDRGWRG